MANRHGVERRALPARARPRGGVKRAFRVHGALGMTFGAALFVICASGALAAVSSDVDWLVHPALRAPALADGAPRASWGALHASARAHAPDARVIVLAAPLEPGFAAEAIVARPDDTLARIWLDPRDARVRGEGPYLTVQRFARDLHRSLFLGENVGVFVVALFGLALLGSTASGVLVVWRSRSRRLLRVAKERASKDLHRVGGLALVAFALLAGITGTWYGVERVAAWADVELTPAAPSIDEAGRARATSEPIADLDTLVALGRAAMPELEVRAIAMPTERRPVLSLLGETDALLARDQANQVFLDPGARVVLGVWRADAMPPIERWVHTVDALHFGSFGGLPTRALWSAMAIGTALLALSGAWIRARRSARSSIEAQGGAA
ncbi:putative iron-regulated membrane protein [Sandaracinus amylolyticus]|uniref:Putative iron-regulated membrane protein n=2 Tax=Sandaracinus amylolyticus TaxID=927083 RepID=A0A0F6SH37_9BACT|nr:putative iron-regulated membrane protein [Sandaracinus amylolyticus]